MLPTLLKFLIHGLEIIENGILSIGELSEEARNRDFKNYREQFSQLRVVNRGLFNRFILSSDSYISNLTRYERNKKQMFNTGKF